MVTPQGLGPPEQQPGSGDTTVVGDDDGLGALAERLEAMSDKLRSQHATATTTAAGLPTSIRRQPESGVGETGRQAEAATPVVRSWRRGDEGTVYAPTIAVIEDAVLGSVVGTPGALVVDITEMLPPNLDSDSPLLPNYVNAAVVGNDLEIQVDVDGTPGEFQPQFIVVLTDQGVPLAGRQPNFILRSLLEDGNLRINRSSVI